MTDMIERAARTIYEERAAVPPTDPAKWSDASEETREWIRGHVRAALLAALDLSNDKRTFQLLVTTLAVADDGHPDGLKYREQAKAVLSMFHSECAQGERRAD